MISATEMGQNYHFMIQDSESLGEENESGRALIEVPFQQLMAQGGVGQPHLIPEMPPLAVPLAQPTARDLMRVIFEQILALAHERGIVGVTQEMINSAQETFGVAVNKFSACIKNCRLCFKFCTHKKPLFTLNSPTFSGRGKHEVQR